MNGFLADSEIDSLFVVASREDVESGSLQELLNTLSSLMSSKEAVLRFLGKVDFRIHGYDNDPRELFEIPEVCQFIRRLDEQFPYWFFFLTTETDAIKLFMFSLCRITRVSPTATACNQEDFANFINHHLAAMNYIFDTFNIDEERNIERNKELQRYFLES